MSNWFWSSITGFDILSATESNELAKVAKKNSGKNFNETDYWLGNTQRLEGYDLAKAQSASIYQLKIFTKVK